MVNTLQIKRAACAHIPTEAGSFQLCVYENNRDDKEHLAILMGDVSGGENILVRIHSECFTGDVLGSRRCDCGDQLHAAMELIAAEQRGIILYLRQEGRGIGLAEKLKAYNLQDSGLDTVDANLALGHAADGRDYSIAAAILRDLGVQSVRLITNNPDKISELGRLDIAVVARVAIETAIYPENAGYMRTKAERMNHLLDPLSLASVLVGALSIPAKANTHNVLPANGGQINYNGSNGQNGRGVRGNRGGHHGYHRYNGSTTR
jgi:3,4-dihydroxy 2-butanone 4-phosphate synthase/GTP cyclohydrolase II